VSGPSPVLEPRFIDPTMGHRGPIAAGLPAARRVKVPKSVVVYPQVYLLSTTKTSFVCVHRLERGLTTHGNPGRTTRRLLQVAGNLVSLSWIYSPLLRASG